MVGTGPPFFTLTGAERSYDQTKIPAGYAFGVCIQGIDNYVWLL